MQNHKRLNQILLGLEPLLVQLVGKYKLAGVSLEPWRWDEPGITLTWFTSDNIGRNIHTQVVDDGPSLDVEVNAWQDQDEQEGKVRVRHWRHEFVKKVDASTHLEQLGDVLETAYKEVSTWEQSDLEKLTYITSAAAGP